MEWQLHRAVENGRPADEDQVGRSLPSGGALGFRVWGLGFGVWGLGLRAVEALVK